MGKVKTLREEVYKKIAAGEVVERPLSVVKELVENAIDAGADDIKIEAIDGGKQMIRVSDNGSGFAPDDVETAFKNHSTSKISELEDFDHLNTLGFRGEALPSILEVSKIELKTSDNTDGRGISCYLEAGKILEKKEIAHHRGSTIEVKELFYNFPVREKFLKSDRTELNQIISFLEPMTLVHYDKSFELVHNGRSLFAYKKNTQMRDRIYQVFGKEFLDQLREVSFLLENYQIKGFISQLNTGVAVKKNQYFFVNKRPVKEKTLMAALNNTFERYLEKSRKPAAILMLDIPPGEVDVNIHPMKLEIKFVDSSRVYRFLKHAIDHSFGAVSAAASSLDDSADVAFSPGRGGTSYGSSFHGGKGSSGIPGGWQTVVTNLDTPGSTGESIRNPTSFAPGAFSAGQFQRPALNDYEQSQLFSTEFLNEDDFVLIGQYKNSYILIEKGGDLLVIDQHNAQERINFDSLKKEYLSAGVSSVNPLFPVILELSPSEVAEIDQEKIDFLAKLGFRLEPLSGHAFDVKSFPQILGERNIKDALLTVIHLNEGDINFEDSILAEIACKSAIKINHKLFPDQMKTIVKNLLKSSNPYFCPHKRPIIIEFKLEQIEKLMKRK